MTCNCKTPTDAEEKQWHIEVETLEIEKLRLQKEIAEARALEATHTKAVTTFKVDCSACGAGLNYTGTSEYESTKALEKFIDAHAGCI